VREQEAWPWDVPGTAKSVVPAQDCLPSVKVIVCSPTPFPLPSRKVAARVTVSPGLALVGPVYCTDVGMVSPWTQSPSKLLHSSWRLYWSPLFSVVLTMVPLGPKTEAHMSPISPAWPY
jgi:hypothetical protein